MNMPNELPDEIAELLQQHEEEKIVKLEAFSRMVAKKRDEAVAGRQNSGIEQIWEEDEQHYDGIDQANKGRQSFYKPTGPNSGFVPKGNGGSNTRSTVFLNITRPYVDAIVARTCDILLPTDDKNWGLQPTPIPELIDEKDNTAPLPPAPVPNLGPNVPNPGTPQPTIADLVEKIFAQAKTASDKAERRIEDWLAESGYNAENRKVIFSSAKLGTGIIKGPFPEKSKSTSIEKKDGQTAIRMDLQMKPKSKCIDVWNAFPDPACGENIHDGNFFFERDFLTKKGLRELKGLPGYDDKSIDKVLEEGPRGREKGGGNPSKRADDKDLYEIFYGYLEVGKEDLKAFGVEVGTYKGDSIHALVTLVNDTAIRAAVNPLDSGKFPYDVMCWQQVAGQWAGLGVSRQIRSCQQALNAAHRNLLDNAGLSGGPILIVRRNMIEPADGDWTLRPRKIFYATPDADIRSVNDAITVVHVPSMEEELMGIIQFELKTAELVTGFPLLMQGQNSNSAPDTYGGQILATNNASTVLRHVARIYDDSITVPQIKAYYEYLLQYSDDETEKGDFQVIARGSTALVEREIQSQEQLQLLSMCANPAFGLDPKKVMNEWFRSRRFDPRKFQYSDEELAQIKAQPAQPPLPIAVAQIKADAEQKVATIKTEGAIKQTVVEHQLEADPSRPSPAMIAATARVNEAQIKANSEIEREKARADWEIQYVENERMMAAQTAQVKNAELQLRRDLALLEYANREKATLESVKKDLAVASMQETTKRELASAELQLKAMDKNVDREHDSVKHVQNLTTNVQQAQDARMHENEKMREQHAHEIELGQQKLAALKKKAQNKPVAKTPKK